MSDERIPPPLPTLDALVDDVMLSMTHPYRAALGPGHMYSTGEPIWQALLLTRAIVDMTAEMRRLREALEAA